MGPIHPFLRVIVLSVSSQSIDMDGPFVVFRRAASSQKNRHQHVCCLGNKASWISALMMVMSFVAMAMTGLALSSLRCPKRPQGLGPRLLDQSLHFGDARQRSSRSAAASPSTSSCAKTRRPFCRSSAAVTPSPGTVRPAKPPSWMTRLPQEGLASVSRAKRRP